MSNKKAFRAATAFSIITLAFAALLGTLLYAIFVDEISFLGPNGAVIVRELGTQEIAVIISLAALISSSIGTTSTIMLGWRSERRQAAEYKLKIEQLQLQLAEARAKTVLPPSIEKETS